MSDLLILTEDHKTESLFAERLISGKPKNIFSNWPSNNNVEEQVIRAKEIFYSSLIFHFIIEEVIFSRLYDFVDDSLKHLFNELIKKHIEIKLLFGSLEISSNSEYELREQLIDLGKLLKNHIEIEENQIFPILKSDLYSKIINEIPKNVKSRINLDISH